MSDRVSFATLEETIEETIAARKYHISGFNGFPFAIPTVEDGDTGDGTAYNVRLSRRAAIFAYWRVRKWKITVDFNWPFVPNDPGPGTHVGPYPYNRDWFTAEQRNGFGDDPITRERNICMSPGWLDGNDDTTSNFWFFNPEDVGGWRGQAVLLDGSIYPFALIDVESPDGPSTYSGAPYAAGTMKIIIPAFSPDTTIFNADILRATNSGWSGTLTITAQEYWPYANSAGEPIYDATSGAQLRDPLS